MPKLTTEQRKILASHVAYGLPEWAEPVDAAVRAALSRIDELEGHIVALRTSLADVVESSKCVGGVDPKEWRTAAALLLLTKTDP